MTETLSFRNSLSSENLKQQRSLFGFVGSLFKNMNLILISRRRRRSCANCLSIPPTHFEIKDVKILLQDIFQHTLFNLHSVHKILATSNSPSHLNELQYEFVAHKIFDAISNYNDFSERLPMILQTPDNVFLQRLRHRLIIFLSKIHVEVMVFDTRKTSIGSFLHSINGLFLELKQELLVVVVGNEISMIGPLSFEELLSDRVYDTSNAVKVTRSNLKNLDTFVSLVIYKYGNPIKKTHHGMRYTFGAIGFSLLSVWLLRNRGNFVLRSKESITLPSTSNVDQPLTDTTRDKPLISSSKEMTESKQLHSLSDYLHRMMLDFSDRTKNFLANTPFKGMVERINRSSEKPNKYLIKDPYWQDFDKSTRLQKRKQKYDLGMEMPELERLIWRTDEIISESVARIKSFFFVLGVRWIYRRLEKHTMETTQDKRISYTHRAQTRQLIDQVEQRIAEAQNYQDLLPPNEEAHYKNGLALYSLDRLFRAVGRDANSMVEWRGFHRDIFILMKPKAIPRLKEWYE